MSTFSAVDYVVFAVYMIASVGLGVWFVKEQRTVKDYFLAGQSMNWFVVAVSVIAALFSGISYLGAPTEVYSYDLTYAVSLLSFFIVTPVVILVFLPFFYRLNLYSAYEYLEKRFDLQVRTWSSAMFIIRVIFYLALAIYAPALALASVTSLPLWFSILAVGLLTTIYTTLGGMKAVIWTDVLQFFVLLGGQLAIGWVAVSRIPGGWAGAYDLAASAGKLNFLNFDWNLTVRVTFWGALLGGLFNNLVQMGTDQISVQRYLTARSLPEATRSLWFKLIVTVPLVIVFYLMGAVLFAFYRTHPGLEPALAQKDRILPYFVVTQLPHGLPGLLIAAIFAATMSTVSAGINALSTASIVDFFQRFRSTAVEPERLLRLSKWLTCFYGLVATGAAFVMPYLGTLIEATNKIMGLLGGPLLGVFLLGMLTRRANSHGTLLGAFFGALLLAYVAFQTKVSFLWYALIGCLATMALGYLFSLATGKPSAAQVQGLVYHPGLSRTSPGESGGTPQTEEAKA